MTDAVLDLNQSLLFAQYGDRLRRARSPLTVKNWDIISRRFDTWLRVRALSAETAKMGDLEEYFDQLPLADSSKQTHLSYIQAAYSYGARRGTVRENPAIDVLLRKPDPREPRVISNEELRQIRSGIIRDKVWMFFHLLVYTGMRRAELSSLRWDDGKDGGSVVRLEEQLMRVTGKGNKPRYVPIHPILGECFSSVDRTPGAFVIPSYGRAGVSVNTVQSMSRDLHPVYTPHDYRRTAATSLRRNGVDNTIRDAMMGWAAGSVFERSYNNVAEAELHRGILRLYADDPIG